MAQITELEQAVLDNLQDVLGSEALIERRLRRSRKTGKWSANLADGIDSPWGFCLCSFLSFLLSMDFAPSVTARKVYHKRCSPR